MNKLDIGIIGTGNFAHKVHIPVLTERDDVNLAAICDVNQERLDRIFKQYRIGKKFSDYKEMIERIPLDGVFIITPPLVTANVALHCLLRGINTFIEKPPGMKLEETEKLARAAKNKGCKTMVGFNRRFCPLVRKAKEMVEKRGQIVQALVNFHKPAVYGDDLVGDIIHVVDVLRYICGEPQKLFSKISQFYGDKDNSFNSVIEFENKSVGILSCYRSSGTRYERFEIHGKNIAAYIRPPRYAQIYEGNKCILLEESKIATFHHAYGYFDEVNHFIEGIKQDKLVRENNIFEALKTMQLVYAIKEFQNKGSTEISKIHVNFSKMRNAS